MSGSSRSTRRRPATARAPYAAPSTAGRTLEVFNVGEYGGVHAARDVAKVREKVDHAHELGRLFRSDFDPAAAAALQRAKRARPSPSPS